MPISDSPPAAIYSKDGKPLLSWRVAILPYLGLDNLYKQFHLDEPWDSPHNIKLSAMPVAVYLSPMMKNNMTPDKKSFLTDLRRSRRAGHGLRRQGRDDKKGY